ncbi:MAG: serine/threonine-protein phosphatase [Clostridia bacterium]|nr:serine/threonine-protein phosphatase [Clostridia bacterium]
MNRSSRRQDPPVQPTTPAYGETMPEIAPPPDSCPYTIGSAQTIGKRKAQEDSFLTSDLGNQEWKRRGVLAAVADGVGGLGNGQVASTTAMRTLIANYAAIANSDLPAEKKLLRLMAHAQAEVLKVNNSGTRCACTFICALVHDMNLSFLSLGDSHIYLCRAGGLLQLNRDHVLGDAEDEREVLNLPLTPNPRRKAITSFLGKADLRQIDRNVTPIRLQAGDSLLLMSDGVFGTLSDDEIISCVHGTAQDTANAIIKAVVAADVQGQDNATCVVIACNTTC